MNADFDPNRDYVGEMRAKVDELAAGAYYPPMVAHRIVSDCQTNDPELLRGWLYLQAEEMLRSAINQRDRSIRQKARYRSVRADFAADAEEARRSGDNTVMGRWLSAPFSLSTGVRMTLRDMNRDQLLDAGRQYQTRAETQLLMSTFLNAVARQVGTGVVSQVYSEAQLASMWRSLNGG